jgi:hypothetical protein
MISAKRRATVIAAACLTIASSATILSRHSSDRTEAAAPAAGVFVADKGNFRIMVNGQQVGKEEFEIAPAGGDWVARGSSDVQTSDGSTHVTGTLQLHVDGSPVRYQWATQGKKKASATIDFSNLTATINLNMEGARPYTQQFTFNSSPIAILDNNLYHQYAVLARLYDWQKRGAQTFSVLVPQELAPGMITVESQGDQNVNGKRLEELTAKTEDLEVDLYLDNGKLVRLVAPGNNAEIVRE